IKLAAMRITRRTKAIAFFITLGACLVALTIFLNITWIVFHWRQVVPLVLGIIFFSVIIAGLVVNTIFIVREIRRNERQDSFLNAVKYSGENKNIVVDVRTPDIDSIFFSVRDQGIGIPRVELKRIFNRFYRIQNPATGKVKGTGLGLFIVRSVVRRYGGDAFAESQGEGFGSTFTIRLPRGYRASAAIWSGEMKQTSRQDYASN